MAKYRVKHRFPCFIKNSYIPRDGYFVQVLKESLFTDKWIDIKGFVDEEDAVNLLNLLKS